jgi:formylglycine-generating enzyme required for sulfatase activity
VDTLSNALPQNLNLYRYHRKNKSYTEDLGSEVKLILMLIPAGEFMMGTPADEPESFDRERPQHLVQVPQFMMGRYPVTQAQWRVVAGYEQGTSVEINPDPSKFKGDNRPVEQVSWEEAQEFCQRLSEITGKNYRLPSEAEWEYACRAGTVTPFHFGATISSELANYRGSETYNNGPEGEYRKETTDVGVFPANDWGLYDMHGNVWEWCEDDWHENYQGALRDGSAWVDADRSKTRKLVRGGSWFVNPYNCRSASRGFDIEVGNYVGFRVVWEPPRLLLSS